MPNPNNYLRPCQVERGQPDIHDIPVCITATTIGTFMDKGGKQRDRMKRNRERIPAYHDFFLRQHHHIVSVAALMRTQKGLTK